jgi:hypothetical protein
MRSRWLAILLAVVALGAVSWAAWRWEIQKVNVVIVNASGAAATFSWQPRLFAADETVAIGGCESKSIELRAGARWRLAHDQLEMQAAIVEVPLLTPEVALEIWLATDGSSRYVPAYPVDAPVPAPYPAGCPATS